MSHPIDGATSHIGSPRAAAYTNTYVYDRQSVGVVGFLLYAVRHYSLYEMAPFSMRVHGVLCVR